MLTEFKNVAQKPEDDGRRRWFSDNQLELIVWYCPENMLTGFQFCYDIGAGEHAVTWKNNYLHHNKIDDGDIGGAPNMSPILVPDGIMPKDQILKIFKENCLEIEYEIAQFVIDKLS